MTLEDYLFTVFVVIFVAGAIIAVICLTKLVDSLHDWWTKGG
jgi:hypothetical protein